MKKRIAASDAFVSGDVEPLIAVSAAQDPVTIFGPMGGVVSGAVNVNAVNEAGAGMFAKGSENEFEIRHSSADENLAYFTGIQRSNVMLKGKDEPFPMELRVTEIFRREAGEWKLIHRHADAKVQQDEKK